jgi:hypothetical protein
MSPRPVTRAKNTHTHLGIEALGETRKRQKSEVEAEKRVKAGKLAKAKKEKGLKKVAEIEERLMDEDNIVNPQPNTRLGCPQPIHRTTTHAFIPLYGDGRSEPESEESAGSYTTCQDQGSDAAGDHSGDADMDTELEEQPTVKKQKTSQSEARDAGRPGIRPSGDEVQVQVAARADDKEKTHAKFV